MCGTCVITSPLSTAASSLLAHMCLVRARLPRTNTHAPPPHTHTYTHTHRTHRECRWPQLDSYIPQPRTTAAAASFGGHHDSPHPPPSHHQQPGSPDRLHFSAYLTLDEVKADNLQRVAAQLPVGACGGFVQGWLGRGGATGEGKTGEGEGLLGGEVRLGRGGATGEGKTGEGEGQRVAAQLPVGARGCGYRGGCECKGVGGGGVVCTIPTAKPEGVTGMGWRVRDCGAGVGAGMRGDGAGLRVL